MQGKKQVESENKEAKKDLTFRPNLTKTKHINKSVASKYLMQYEKSGQKQRR